MADVSAPIAVHTNHTDRTRSRPLKFFLGDFVAVRPSLGRPSIINTPLFGSRGVNEQGDKGDEGKTSMSFLKTMS